MKELYLEIPGKPVAKQRPRFVSTASKKAYNAQKTEEGRWIWKARSQISYKVHHEPLTGPIILNLVFIMPVTKAFSKSKIQMLKDGIKMPHIKRPDLDNLIKWVMDCCNGWLWKDDKQVCQIDAYKFYDLEAKTLIKVIEMQYLGGNDV